MSRWQGGPQPTTRRWDIPSRRVRGHGWLLALDLETTGCDPTAEILAVGTVVIADGAVLIGTSTHTLVRPQRRSAVAGIEAHELRPSDVAGAATPAEVMPPLLARIHAADALLVHHAGLDVTVLRRCCKATGLRWPRPTVIDTVRLIERLRHRQRTMGERGPRVPRDLAGSRAALGLPTHPAHDAAADAIATAELYLALQARLAR